MKKTQNNFHWLIIAMCIFCTLLSSCDAEKQALRQQAKEIRRENKKVAEAKATFARNPLAFAADCGRQFPPRTFDSTGTTLTEVSKGAIIDSINNKVETDITAGVIELLRRSGDSSVQHIVDSLLKHPIIVEGDCPPTYIYAPDTVKSKTERFRTTANTATEEGLRREKEVLVGQAATAVQQVKDLEGDKATIKRWLIGSGIGNLLFLLFIVAFIMLKIKGKISFL